MKTMKEIEAVIENRNEAIQAGTAYAGHELRCYLSADKTVSVIEHYDADAGYTKYAVASPGVWASLLSLRGDSAEIIQAAFNYVDSRNFVFYRPAKSGGGMVAV